MVLFRSHSYEVNDDVKKQSPDARYGKHCIGHDVTRVFALAGFMEVVAKDVSFKLAFLFFLITLPKAKNSEKIFRGAPRGPKFVNSMKI